VSVSAGEAKVALVVGNSDGIGLAFTRRLLAEGWTVVGVSRRVAAIESDRYAHHVIDASSPTFREALTAVVPARVDLCVYCAGIGEAFDPSDLAMDATTVRVNFEAMVSCAAAVIPSMVRARDGHFVGLSSIGDGVSSDAPAYAASKAGVSSYLAGLALALRPKGVFVTNVRFGFVDTKMAKSPVKPWMISVDQACDVLARVLRTRPAVRSFPRKMAALVWLLDRWAALRLSLS
jgi:NAD(P)-dependent dehydrogenase (short-subunit alcohol dehydrogenase family)